MDPTDLILAVLYTAVAVVAVATILAIVGPLPEAC